MQDAIDQRMPENGAGRRSYDGQTCPFHSDMCKQVRAKVPIWVLTLLVGGLFVFSGTVGTLAVKSFNSIRSELATVGKTLVKVETNQKILMREFNTRYED
jgi:hypothetical protein